MNMINGNSSASDRSVSSPVPVVFVVDEDASVRKSLELLIRGAGWQPMTFASAEEFLTYPRVVVCSCLVLDVTLPDLSGLELQKLVADRSELPVIFVTGCTDVSTTVQAMKGGAMDFFTKPFTAEALLTAIRCAIERSGYALLLEAEIQSLRKRYASLSHREREVMNLVICGHLNKQIGGELGISEITVKAHRGKMMRKMQARSLADLVNMGAKRSDRPPGRDVPLRDRVTGRVQAQVGLFSP